jgi:hypothetical protein
MDATFTTAPKAVPGRLLHLVALTSVAVLQPVLDAIARNEAFLREGDLRWPELTGLVFVLGCGLPAVMRLLDLLFGWASQWLGGHGRDAVLFGLAWLGALAILRPVLVVRALEEMYLLWAAVGAVALVAAWLVLVLYRRSRLFRQWLAIGACGAVLFPAAFAVQVHQRTVQREAAEITADFRNPVPVVIVAFDEFSGITLMNDALEIDAERFPQFARLASSSTWYRRATSVHSRTHMAIPALLSGRYPDVDRGPYLENYPQNLLRLTIDSGAYQTATFELVTRLCRRPRSRPQPAGFGERLGKLLWTAVLVYPQLVASHDAPVEFPRLPNAWHGLEESPGYSLRDTTGAFSYSWGRQREVELDHFMRCVYRSGLPRFYFLHAGLPHFPWSFLPSGNHYLAELELPSNPPSAVGSLGEDWLDDPRAILRSEYRYLQQVGYVDRFLGQLQDRLQSQGLWDSCLLIVAADHGVSFLPGHSRRVPDATNLADLMSVPLFIKYPHQTAGSIDDRNVETIDVFPTVLDVLDMAEAPWFEPVDGSSLRSSASRPRKTFYFEGGMTVVEPDFPQQRQAVRRFRERMGAGPIDRLPASCVSRPDWLGRNTSEFTIRDHDLPALEIATHFPESGSVTSQFVPTLVTGTLSARDLPSPSAEVVVAVDGVIYDVAPFDRVDFETFGFESLLPESAAATGQRVELFLPGENDSVLRRVRSWTIE